MAYLEAHIDFAPDEVGDYQPESLMPLMVKALDKLLLLLQSYSTGLRVRERNKGCTCLVKPTRESQVYIMLC